MSARALRQSARGEAPRRDALALVSGPSDVIGLAIFLQPPAAGEAAGAASRVPVCPLLSLGLFWEVSTRASPRPAASTDVPMNQIRFFKNGRDQGVAFENVPPGALARDARAARYVA